MMAILAVKITAIGNPAIGNRGYTDKTRLRGLKIFLVRGGGHCLCSREFYSPGLLPIEITAIGNRVYTDKTRRKRVENILSPRRRTLFV